MSFPSYQDAVLCHNMVRSILIVASKLEIYHTNVWATIRFSSPEELTLDMFGKENISNVHMINIGTILPCNVTCLTFGDHQGGTSTCHPQKQRFSVKNCAVHLVDLDRLPHIIKVSIFVSTDTNPRTLGHSYTSIRRL
jgi:hypothetical protein